MSKHTPEMQAAIDEVRALEDADAERRRPKHTPGPWRLTDEPVRRVVKGGKPERSIVIVEEWTREEDARLIAAAPLMVEALQACVEAISGGPMNPAQIRALVMAGDALRRAGL